MPHNEKISCIIPVFNRVNTIRRAVESVLEQDGVCLELVVVDDGSTDETAEVLRGIEDQRLQLVRQENQGVSAARNRGIAESAGQWLALLDSDDEWLPGKLKKQMEFFMENPEMPICQTEEIWIRKGRRVNPMKKHKKYGGWIFDKCLPRCVVSPSAVMMRRSLFEEVGGFDETLPACEDYDLWLRIACRYPVGLVNEALMVKYGGHEDQLSRTVPYLDRYRIDALEKILKSGRLDEDQYEAALEELKTKCRIYGQGCLKHGREEEGRRVLGLAAEYEK
jgi:glycosyltransferase involved in cell wall biosynthesis